MTYTDMTQIISVDLELPADAHALATQGDWAGAERAFDAARGTAAQAGDDVALAVALTNRGHALAYLGRFVDSAAALAESVAVRERLHARGAVSGAVVARGLMDAAVVAAARGEGADAAQLIECAGSLVTDAEAPELTREIGRLRAAIRDVALLPELAPSTDEHTPDEVVLDTSLAFIDDFDAPPVAGLDATPVDVSDDAESAGATPTDALSGLTFFDEAAHSPLLPEAVETASMIDAADCVAVDALPVDAPPADDSQPAPFASLLAGLDVLDSDADDYSPSADFAATAPHTPNERVLAAAVDVGSFASAGADAAGIALMEEPSRAAEIAVAEPVIDVPDVAAEMRLRRTTYDLPLVVEAPAKASWWRRLARR